MTDLPSLAVSASFTLWGKPAIYTPPSGATVACTVLVDFRQAKQPTEFGSKPPVEGWVVSVRQSELAAPLPGGRFAVGDKNYAIVGKPTFEDPQQLVWICSVA